MQPGFVFSPVTHRQLLHYRLAASSDGATWVKESSRRDFFSKLHITNKVIIKKRETPGQKCSHLWCLELVWTNWRVTCANTAKEPLALTRVYKKPSSDFGAAKYLKQPRWFQVTSQRESAFCQPQYKEEVNNITLTACPQRWRACCFCHPSSNKSLALSASTNWL